MAEPPNSCIAWHCPVVRKGTAMMLPFPLIVIFNITINRKK